MESSGFADVYRTAMSAACKESGADAFFSRGQLMDQKSSWAPVPQGHSSHLAVIKPKHMDIF